MRVKATLLFFVLPLIGAEPAGYKYWSAAELKGFAKTLAPQMSAQKAAMQRIADFGGNYAMMVYREGTGDAEFHANEADVYFISSGSATLVVGGTLKDGRTTAAGEMRAPSMEGGVRQKLAAGDVAHIPPKTPHQLLVAPGTRIAYFVFKTKE